MADTLVAVSRVGVAQTLTLVATVTGAVVTVVAVRAWNAKLFKIITHVFMIQESDTS